MMRVRIQRDKQGPSTRLRVREGESAATITSRITALLFACVPKRFLPSRCVANLQNDDPAVSSRALRNDIAASKLGT